MATPSEDVGYPTLLMIELTSIGRYTENGKLGYDNYVCRGPASRRELS